VHGHAHGAQVTDPHDTANDITAEVVKDQDFPNRIAIAVEDGGNRGEQAVGESFFGFARFNCFVEIKNLLKRGYASIRYVCADKRRRSSLTDLAIAQGVAFGRHSLS
jgi:hypothetical protein